LILKLRRGQGADAPVKKEKVEVIEGINEEGEKIKKIKTIEIKIGFSLILRIDKSQISGCIEGQELRLSFYFEEGLKED
jgi:hypothetical protein